LSESEAAIKTYQKRIRTLITETKYTKGLREPCSEPDVLVLNFYVVCFLGLHISLPHYFLYYFYSVNLRNRWAALSCKSRL